MKRSKYVCVVTLSFVYVITFLFASPALSQTQLTFSTGLDLPQSYRVGFNPRSIDIGDFNGDGIKDIAVGNFESDFASIFLGRNNGVLNPIGNVVVGRGSLLAVSDLNRDSKSDIVVLTGNQSLKAFLATANNSFTQSFSYSITEFFSVNSIAVGDFDRDGNSDVIVNSLNIYFFHGNGNGTFAQPISSLSNSSNHISVSDFNNDCHPDIIQTRLSSVPFIQFGDGTGRFSAPISIGSFSGSTSSAVHDINRDGNLDVAVTSTSSGVGIFLGNGNGVFTFLHSIPIEFSRRVVMSDFNNDGNIDMALTNELLNAVSVLSGDGTGGFTLEEKYKVGQNPWGIVAADFNGDQKSDLVATNSRYNASTIANNTISTLYGNGTGRFIAARRYADVMASSVIIADLNNDSSQDVIISDAASNEIAISLGPWNGAFNSLIRISIGTSFQIIGTADFNNDAKSDLVIQTQNGVSIQFGRGTGYFRKGTNIPGTGRVFVSDFNNDNKPDLGFFSSTEDSFVKFTVWFGTGAGKFRNPVETVFEIFSFNYIPQIADLNNDGLRDLVIAESTNIYSFLGNGSGIFGDSVITTVETPVRSIAIKDFNGDQINDLLLGSFDRVTLLSGTGTGSFVNPIDIILNTLETVSNLHIADFNNDALLDFAATVDDGTLFFINQGTGTFGAPIRRIKGLGALGDINGDNLIDSVGLTDTPSSGGIVVSLNRY